MKTKLIPLLVCATFWGAAMPAQTQSAPSLAGRVSDTNGRPLPQAQVTLTRIGRNVLTDATGRFVFRNVPVGIHRVQATFMGYAHVG